MNYLVSMVAEDIISDKDSKDASKKGFLKNLMDKKKGKTDASWTMNTCKDKPLSKTNHGDAFQNKIQKWEFRKLKWSLENPKHYNFALLLTSRARQCWL